MTPLYIAFCRYIRPFLTRLLGWLLLGLVGACTSANPEVVNPSLVKIFVQSAKDKQGISTPISVLVTDLVATPDNGVLLVGIANSNLANKFSQGSLFMMKLSTTGERVWSKQYDTLASGFPSNLVLDNNNIVCFWNSYDAIKDKNTPSKYTYRQLTWKANETNAAINFSSKIISVECGNTKDGCGYIAKAIPNLANSGYAMITAGINTLTANVHAVYLGTLGVSSHKTIPISTKIVTDLGEGIQPLWRLDNYLQLTKTSTNYFFNVPIEGQRMALVGTGDRSIVYADRRFWITDIATIDNNKVNAVTTPIDTIANAHYISNMALLPNNTTFSNYIGFATELSPTVVSNNPVCIITLKNGNQVIAGTSRQEGIILKVVSQVGTATTITKNINLATGGYSVTGIQESADGKNLFITGTNRLVGSSILAPFIIVIPTTDLVL